MPDGLCVSVDDAPFEVPPRGEKVFEVKVRVPGKPGAFVATRELFTDSADCPRVPLELRGNVLDMAVESRTPN